MKKFRNTHLLKILHEWEKTHSPLDYFLSCYYRKHKNLGSNDRKYISERLFTLIRWKKLIDYFVRSPISWEKRVSALDDLSSLKNQATGCPPDIAFSFPSFLYMKFEKQFGKKKAEEICTILNHSAPLTIRANRLKVSRDELLEKWKNRFLMRPTTLSEDGVIFLERASLFHLPEFTDGLFEVQDEGSQIIAQQLHAKPGMQILDFCAGSGGKTLAFAPDMEGKGQIYLHDVRKSILLQAKKRLKRAGIDWGQTVAPNSRALSLLKRKMDIVLVDVPCSGVGTLRRNPEQKWRLKPCDIEDLVQMQRKIFIEALQYLKPKGKIIYATCSILREENHDQVEYFTKNHPVDLSESPQLILPQEEGRDGFFFATFHRKENIDKMVTGNQS